MTLLSSCSPGLLSRRVTLCQVSQMRSSALGPGIFTEKTGTLAVYFANCHECLMASAIRFLDIEFCKWGANCKESWKTKGCV